MIKKAITIITRQKRLFISIVCLLLISSACMHMPVPPPDNAAGETGMEPGNGNPDKSGQKPAPIPPFPVRPIYSPGELVDYIAQSGDTLPELALHFNTTVAEIFQANSFIPQTATTMPPGMPMKIPIYYKPFWGNSYNILPDSLFVNGPAQVDFNTSQFVSRQPGWLKDYVGFAGDSNRSGAEIIDLVATNFSVSPRLLLALLEYQTGVLSQPKPPKIDHTYPMGYQKPERKDLYQQLIWTANTLNNGYYGWRTGRLLSIEYPDGQIEQFDPWLDAGTAALHYLFNQLATSGNAYQHAIAPQGVAATYRALFGDPWVQVQPHMAGSVEQPPLALPFLPGGKWALTGGPHTGWGTGDPLAALDFAPPSVGSGCVRTEQWATAVADGVVVRSETGVVVLDTDGDNDERTGWIIFYLHAATNGRVPVGTVLKRGDSIGHPSCEGGSATGTHIHIARKYNGEWLPAEGTLGFNLEGWIAHNGSEPYLGTLTRNTQIVTACDCSNAASFIESEQKMDSGN